MLLGKPVFQWSESQAAEPGFVGYTMATPNASRGRLLTSTCIGAGIGVAVGMGVGVAVGVRVGLGVAVGIGVYVGVGVDVGACVGSGIVVGLGSSV